MYPVQETYALNTRTGHVREWVIFTDNLILSFAPSLIQRKWTARPQKIHCNP